MTLSVNSAIRTPLSLRGPFAAAVQPGVQVALACLAGAAWTDAAEAEERASSLPVLTVDAPAARRHSTPAKPSAAQQRARAALRNVARQQKPQAAAPASSSQSSATTDPLQYLPGPSPYTHPGAPYLSDRVASQKFTEPVANTPRTITILSKEVLADKNATSLRDVARTTAGLTLGAGEGGNAFGDRFFIRGFDARNDIFIDGVRDPGVSIRENFFTEQVEILRGPGSSYAGRGTAGGAINIVPKAAGDTNFRSVEATYGTDMTKRVTIDVNQVINPTLSVRAGGLLQGAEVSGRDYTTDNRNGAFAAFKWTPADSFILTGNYIHTDLSGIPDFGVPYYRANLGVVGGPVTEYGVSRNNFYGFITRDFQQAQQDIGTLNSIYKLNDSVTISNKLRIAESRLDYIGTLAERPVATDPNPLKWTVTANPQSRSQTTDVIADQTEAVIRFNTADFRHAAVVGAEIAQETVKINNYTGLASEGFGSGFTSSGSLSGVNIFYPQTAFIGFPNFDRTLGSNPTTVPVTTGSVYLIDTANYNDVLLLNGGIRLDDYHITASNTLGANSVHSTLFNYNGGMVLKPIPTVSLYAAYATSSNPVGAELDATGSAYGGLSPTATNLVYGPEINRAMEVGAKWELFDRNLLATAALFRTDKTNARETVGQTVVAGAAYRVQGVDLEIAGKLTPEWSVNGGVVLMQSEVTASNTAPANTTLYLTNVGLPLANIAHQSFNLLTKYEINKTYEIGGQATYMSQIYGGTLAANTGAVLPAHWRFDAFVEMKVAKELTAKVSVNNITNELYYDSLYRSTSPFVMVAPGRTALLTLNARF
ncbi:TonB-dependent receptor [Rhodoblastus sp. 17X3]|uniref:TonB-dependent receptor n=1 Tax=Rhodoblastus sp. 17X3 TaxID=3047026 RepID=UPI0024B720F2|nr:TonB-dependent receptor [Rhodoblastus sp. 17X3]MDI9846764.1 TonB-dependent receptor [Rhodoblastus sp. 17X3]